MEGSTILGWISLGGAAVAAGALLRAYFRPDHGDLRTQLLTEIAAALAVVATLGPLPRLFRIVRPQLVAHLMFAISIS
jgi:hypothetical protein